MSKHYYTLCTKYTGKWSPQFGATTRKEVVQEMEEYNEDCKIVVSGCQQSEIDRAIRWLNEGESK